MNSSELDSEWPGSPDMYEIELTEGHKLVDANFNDTNNNNGTLTIQGKLKARSSIKSHFRHEISYLCREQNCRETGRSFYCDFRAHFVDGCDWVVRSSLGQD